MSTLTLDRVPRIIQGVGALETLGSVVSGLGRGAGVLLVADPGLRGTGMIETAARVLRLAEAAVTVFDEVKSDPSMAQADFAADIARKERVAVVVALGGGSAMDLGKTVAAIAGARAGSSHYGLCANPFPPGRLFNICIPTTAGTGSEATRTAVLSDPEGAKVWLWGDELKPDVILLDPVLTTGLPAHLTAATGIDALVHAIEASTNRNANSANNLYCHEAIRLVVRHLERAVSVPGDLTARAGLQWAATFAGIGIDNCGTAIAHTIGHALASLRPVHHGRAVGLALRATLDWSVQGDDGPFAAAAAAMGEPADAQRLPAAFDRLLRAAGVKVALSGEGHDHIQPAQLAKQMAQPENDFGRRSNRRTAGDDDLLTFATAILTGC
jgi:alcohol dehydrogenase